MHLSFLKRSAIILALIILSALIVWLIYAWYFQPLPDTAIQWLSQVPSPTKADRILVFSPHPDDETIACGGYIATAVQNGSSVWIALITDGNKHGKERIRYAEFYNATRTLGIREHQLFFLGFPDGGLRKENPDKLRQSFERIILTVKPEIVFAPHPLDHHPDHQITGKIVEDLSSSGSFVLYQYLVHYNLFPKPRQYAPNLYLKPPMRLLRINSSWMTFPLSETMEQVKFQATLQYRSQLKDPFDPLLPGLMLGMIRKNELFSTGGK